MKNQIALAALAVTICLILILLISLVAKRKKKHLGMTPDQWSNYGADQMEKDLERENMDRTLDNRENFSSEIKNKIVTGIEEEQLPLELTPEASPPPTRRNKNPEEEEITPIRLW